MEGYSVNADRCWLEPGAKTMNLDRICGLCPVQGGLEPVRTLLLATIFDNQGYASFAVRSSI